MRLRTTIFESMIIVLAVAGCGQPSEAPNEAKLEGFWVLAEPRGGCADEFPTELEFREDGVYLRSQDPDRPAGRLGGGDYSIDEEQNEIMLMGPTDAMVPFTYSLTETELVLADDRNCAVTYRRR